MKQGENQSALSKEEILNAWCNSGRTGNIPCIYDFAERLIRLYEATKESK